MSTGSVTTAASVSEEATSFPVVSDGGVDVQPKRSNRGKKQSNIFRVFFFMAEYSFSPCRGERQGGINHGSISVRSIGHRVNCPDGAFVIVPVCVVTDESDSLLPMGLTSALRLRQFPASKIT